MQEPYFQLDNFELYHGNSMDILPTIGNVNMAFADPPYFLSNDGLTIHNGKIVSVNKGSWDKFNGNIDVFNYSWIKLVREVLVSDGTIWISGTMHNIFSIAMVLKELNFKILNTITWQKKNPPPNFSCRCFTHSTEFIIWARKERGKAHFYNYSLMKALNDNKQMKDVWTFSSISKWEKFNGQHPTQKPLSILSRIILASSRKGDLVLDPFSGSGTTGIAANLLNRRYIGIDIEKEYLEITKKRYAEIQVKQFDFIKKIEGLDYSIIVNYDL